MLSESRTSAPGKTHASLLSLEFRIPVKVEQSEKGGKPSHDIFSEMFVKEFPSEALRFYGKFPVPGLSKVEEAYFSVRLPVTEHAAWKNLVAKFRDINPDHRVIVDDPHMTSPR